MEFDNKRLNQFVNQQDGFSVNLDKKLGLTYSDKVSIKQMREEVMTVIKQIQQKERDRSND
jgi:predicted metal-dependent peptidase